MSQNSFWIAVAAVALAAISVWLVFTILPNPEDPFPQTYDPSVQLEATNPWIIGDPEDAFSYSGNSARSVPGTAILQIDPSTLRGIIEFKLQPDEALATTLGANSDVTSFVLRLELNDPANIWVDQRINRGTNIGDVRLPVTHAQYAGAGDFTILLDNKPQSDLKYGFWSVADALRQTDGAIRNRGLVFSPLLRDQSVFSDPTRAEFTLLLYEAPDSEAVILHAVFPDAEAVTPAS